MTGKNSTVTRTDDSVLPGRVKSFSQKSGWGFIQLFENGLEDSENCKDVFFHRADVARSGTCELRPGILVKCGVVVTGKGEKASNIELVEETEAAFEALPPTPLTCITCCGTGDDLTHRPYESKMSTIFSQPSAAAPSSYSLRATENFTSWQCLECQAYNATPSIRRVMVVCASCSLIHRVQSWICACSQVNKCTSRHCSSCDALFATGCQHLEVISAQGGAEEPIPLSRKVLRARSRWQHGSSGWSHPSMEAPSESTWLQDGCNGNNRCRPNSAEARIEALLQKCEARLLWAHDWLLQGTSTSVKPLSKDWLYRFSEEVAEPKHGLLCLAHGLKAFVPNACADVENADVLQMYEAIGMVLALAVAHRMPLQPLFPQWLARTLLGFPTNIQDLEEFDPELWQKVLAVQNARDVEAMGVCFQEEVVRNGIAKVFPDGAAEPVTGANQASYGHWLKDLYLAKSIELPLKQMKHGFFYALMGDHLMQGLNPEGLASVLNGRCITDAEAVRPLLVVSPSTHSCQPQLEKWLLDTAAQFTVGEWELVWRMATGSCKLAAPGPMGTEQVITVKCDPMAPMNGVPVGNSATNELLLPRFTSPTMLRQILLATLGNQGQGLCC